MSNILVTQTESNGREDTSRLYEIKEDCTIAPKSFKVQVEKHGHLNHIGNSNVAGSGPSYFYIGVDSYAKFACSGKNFYIWVNSYRKWMGVGFVADVVPFERGETDVSFFQYNLGNLQAKEIKEYFKSNIPEEEIVTSSPEELAKSSKKHFDLT